MIVVGVNAGMSCSSRARASAGGNWASRALPTAVAWVRTRRPGSVNIRIWCGLGTWAR